MSACKSHRRQIALRSVQGLSASKEAALLEHLGTCPECRLYAHEVEDVVALYVRDAERPVASSPARVRMPEAQPVVSFKRSFALAAAAAVVLCVALLSLLNRPEPNPAKSLERAGATAPAAVPPVPTIGSSHYLATADVDELVHAEPNRGSAATEVVYSVRARDVGDY